MLQFLIRDGAGNSTTIPATATQPVPGTSLLLSAGGAPVGSSWTLTSLVRVDGDPAWVLAGIDALGGESEVTLFGEYPSGDLLRYRDIFRSRAPTAERLAAVILALATQIDIQRGGHPSNG